MDNFFLVTTEFQRLQNRYAEQFDGFSGENSSQYLCPSQQHNAGKGRPKFLTPRSQLVDLSSLNFTWKAVSEMVGVSQKTVLRRRYEFSLPIGENTYTSITDEELDAKIVSILSFSPKSGERMVIGALTARNIKVEREGVRASISPVDAAKKFGIPLFRCEYISAHLFKKIFTE